jgi:hypothetical protein
VIVEITSRDTFEPTCVEVEDFLEVVHSINLANAAGRSLALFQKDDGEPVAVFISNITRVEPRPDAFIG